MRIRFLASRYITAGLILLFSLMVGGIILGSYYPPEAIYEKEEPWDPEHVPVVLGGHLELNGPDGFPEEAVFVVDGLYVSSAILDKNLQNVTKVCLTYFSLRLEPSSREYLFTSGIYQEDEFVDEESPCLEVNRLEGDGYAGIHPFLNAENRQDKQNISAPLDNIMYFSYPFDYIEFLISCQVTLGYIDDKGQILGKFENKPFITFTDEKKTKGFEYGNPAVLYNAATLSNINLNNYSFRLVRTSSFIYLTAILLVVLLIVPIILPFASSFDTALQSIIAYLLGLWGVRQVVLPNQVVSPNLIDTLLMAFYCIAVFSLVVTWIHQNQTRTTIRLNRNLTPNQYYSFANSNVYHDSQCSRLSGRSSQELIEYDSEQVAAESGKRRCRLCSNRS